MIVMPYGFKEGCPAKGKGDFLCFCLVGKKPHSGYPNHANGIGRGFWITDGEPFYCFMDDTGFIGWKDSICLMYHPIPVEKTRDKDSHCLPDVWDEEFIKILRKESRI